MTDVSRSSDTSAFGENKTQEIHPPLIHHERHDEEETHYFTSTSKKDGIRSFRIDELVKTFQRLVKTFDNDHIYFDIIISFIPKA